MQDFTISNSVLVNLDFTIWTGRAKLDATDIPEAAAAMPPKDLCTAGSIKIFDTEFLKQFRNFKTRADICAAAVGCRLMSGWLVDDANMSQLENELASCYNDWRYALDGFVQEYPRRANEWAISCGQWESLVRQKQPDQYDIGNRFHFGWQTFRLTPETANAASFGNETGDMIQAIPDKALMSVIDSLKDLYNESFNKSNDPSSKAYNALKKIAQRAQALGFANPNAARLAPVLQDLVNRKNHILTRLVLSKMSVPQDVEDILQVNDGQGIDSLLAAPTPTVPDPEPEPVIQSVQMPKPVVQSDISSLMDEAKRLLNTETIPPLTAVNEEGDIIRTDTNEVVMSAQEVAQVGADLNLAVAMREQYDQGIITRSELVSQLEKYLNEGKITKEQYDRNFPYAQPEPEPVPQQPLNSMDVLDSLGLF